MSSIFQDKTLYIFGLFSVKVVIPVDASSFRINMELPYLVEMAFANSNGDVPLPLPYDGIDDFFGKERCIDLFGTALRAHLMKRGVPPMLTAMLMIMTINLSSVKELGRQLQYRSTIQVQATTIS